MNARNPIDSIVLIAAERVTAYLKRKDALTVLTETLKYLRQETPNLRQKIRNHLDKHFDIDGDDIIKDYCIRVYELLAHATPQKISNTINALQAMLEIAQSSPHAENYIPQQPVNRLRLHYPEAWLLFEKYFGLKNTLLADRLTTIDSLRQRQLVEKKSLFWFLKMVYISDDCLSSYQKIHFAEEYPEVVRWADFEESLTLSQKISLENMMRIHEEGKLSTINLMREIYQHIIQNDKRLVEQFSRFFTHSQTWLAYENTIAPSLGLLSDLSAYFEGIDIMKESVDEMIKNGVSRIIQSSTLCLTADERSTLRKTYQSSPQSERQLPGSQDSSQPLQNSVTRYPSPESYSAKIEDEALAGLSQMFASTSSSLPSSSVARSVEASLVVHQDGLSSAHPGLATSASPGYFATSSSSSATSSAITKPSAAELQAKLDNIKMRREALVGSFDKQLTLEKARKSHSMKKINELNAEIERLIETLTPFFSYSDLQPLIKLNNPDDDMVPELDDDVDPTIKALRDIKKEIKVLYRIIDQADAHLNLLRDKETEVEERKTFMQSIESEKASLSPMLRDAEQLSIAGISLFSTTSSSSTTATHGSIDSLMDTWKHIVSDDGEKQLSSSSCNDDALAPSRKKARQ